VKSRISAVDLFCGAGGLTYGLLRSGISVEAGIDIDEQSTFAYETNNPGVRFHAWDLTRKNYTSIAKLFEEGTVRLLAGCAPCQPFSKLTNGIERHGSWDLLDNFGRFVKGIEPELVTMENVPELAGRGLEVFKRFIATLEKLGYWTDYKLVDCVEYGVPQFRTRLVLLASKLGPIAIPKGHLPRENRWHTVRRRIKGLPTLRAGQADARDPIHVAAKLTELNMRRIRATPRDGGSRDAWPKELELDCHRRESGWGYVSIYGRMSWDDPAPTMTTLCNGIGNGRFGHPTQHRAISLREAALLQSFPRRYQFWPRGETVNRKAVARMIGNAVPPALAHALGRALIRHVQEHAPSTKR
jgi:DNA (cytosine-5)-methyltransferase 1